MKRRSLLTGLLSLAALPLAASQLSALTNTNTMSLARCTRLQRARDLLLPAVRGVCTDNPELDTSIEVDWMTGNLLVTGRYTKLNRYLGFCITERSVIDGHFKTEIRPSMTTLVNALTNTTAAEYDRMYGPGGYAT